MEFQGALSLLDTSVTGCRCQGTCMQPSVFIPALQVGNWTAQGKTFCLGSGTHSHPSSLVLWGLWGGLQTPDRHFERHQQGRSECGLVRFASNICQAWPWGAHRPVYAAQLAGEGTGWCGWQIWVVWVTGLPDQPSHPGEGGLGLAVLLAAHMEDLRFETCSELRFLGEVG